MEEEIGRTGRYSIYRAADRETEETVGVAVPSDGGANRGPGWPWADYADMKAARAFVAVEVFGLKSTTRRIFFEWLWLRPDLPGYVGKKKPREFFAPPRGGNFPLSVKRALLEAAEHRCVRCGSAENLQVDHIEPVHMGGEGTFENGQVLCRACHQAKTNAERREYPF